MFTVEVGDVQSIYISSVTMKKIKDTLFFVTVIRLHHIILKNYS